MNNRTSTDLLVSGLKMARAACSARMNCDDCPFYDDGIECMLSVRELGGPPYDWDVEKLEDK